jgi:hypothetical protein
MDYPNGADRMADSETRMETRNVSTFVHLIAFMAGVVHAVDFCFERDSVSVNELNGTRSMCMCVFLHRSFFSNYALSGASLKLRLDLESFRKLLITLKKNQDFNALVMLASEHGLHLTAADGANEPTCVSLPGLEVDDTADLRVPQEVPDARLEVRVEELVSTTQMMHDLGYPKVLLKLVRSANNESAPMLNFSGESSTGGSENFTRPHHVHSASLLDAGDVGEVSGEFKVEALLLLFKGAQKLSQTVHLELNRSKPLALIVNLGVDEDDPARGSSLTVHLMGLEKFADE